MRFGTLLLTEFGIGLLRPAPATWGSLPPVALAFGLVAALSSGGLAMGEHVAVNAVLVAVGFTFSAACLIWGADAEALFDKKDPRAVVADEVAGQCIVLLALPWRSVGEAAGLSWNVALGATAFLAFRFFDIVKPPPARTLQRLRGGRGILIDDLIAGVYAAIPVQLAAHFFWPLVLGG